VRADGDAPVAKCSSDEAIATPFRQALLVPAHMPPVPGIASSVHGDAGGFPTAATQEPSAQR
jgi:hypothetical protein